MITDQILTDFEEALVIAKKHNVKSFTLDYEGSMIVEMGEEPFEIPTSSFEPESDTMMTEQQFNEGDDYLITNPTRLG
jgi:hypothetical protein